MLLNNASTGGTDVAGEAEVMQNDSALEVDNLWNSIHDTVKVDADVVL